MIIWPGGDIYGGIVKGKGIAYLYEKEYITKIEPKIELKIIEVEKIITPDNSEIIKIIENVIKNLKDIKNGNK